MSKRQPPRRSVPADVEQQVLQLSLRRCALCFHLNQDTGVKKGQIAHVDHRRSRSTLENLVFLCLDHHSEYDSTTSQHKNFTVAEVRAARTALYKRIRATAQPPAGPSASAVVKTSETCNEEARLDGFSELLLVHFGRSIHDSLSPFQIHLETRANVRKIEHYVELLERQGHLDRPDACLDDYRLTRAGRHYIVTKGLLG